MHETILSLTEIEMRAILLYLYAEHPDITRRAIAWIVQETRRPGGER